MKKSHFITMVTFLFLGTFNWNLKAQEDPREEIRKIFGEEFFKDFEDFNKRYEKMMKEFFDNDIKSDFFHGQNFDRVLDNLNPHQMLGDGQSKWLETDKERVLILKVEQDDSSPVKIDIDKSSVKVSGTVNKKIENKKGNSSSFSTYSSSFSRSYPVPNDCDPLKAKIENKNGEILIKFPKRKIGTKSPVKYDKSDKTI